MQFEIERLMTPQQVFETETFYADHMRRLIEQQGLNFKGLVAKIADYLDKKGYYDAADRQAAGEQFALELLSVGKPSMNLMTFAFGLKVLGFSSLDVSLRAFPPENAIPIAMCGTVELK